MSPAGTRSALIEGLDGPASDEQFVTPAHRTDVSLWTELGARVARRRHRADGSEHDLSPAPGAGSGRHAGAGARQPEPQSVDRGPAPGFKKESPVPCTAIRFQALLPFRLCAGFRLSEEYGGLYR